MAAQTCTLCGESTSPCCDPNADSKPLPCKDKQACGTDHMCPANIGPGWAGDTCGTGANPCEGTLSCNTTSNQCECNAASAWLTCSKDGDKVCATGGGGGGFCTPDQTKTKAGACSPSDWVCYDPAMDPDKPPPCYKSLDQLKAQKPSCANSCQVKPA